MAKRDILSTQRLGPIQVEAEQPAPEPTSALAPLSTPTSKRRQESRVGTRPVMFWIDEDDYHEFTVATRQMRTTIQAAGEEMYAAWARTHNVRRPSLDKQRDRTRIVGKHS